MTESSITQHSDWTNGDVTLISADNVSFKVRSDILTSNR